MKKLPICDGSDLALEMGHFETGTGFGVPRTVGDFMGKSLSNKFARFQAQGVVLTGLLLLMVGFQNCSPMKFYNEDVRSLGKLGNESFTTREDMLLSAEIKTMGVYGLESQLTVIQQPAQGQLKNFMRSSGAFEYQPKQNFYGDDFFEVVEHYTQEGKVKDRKVKVHIAVLPMNDQPWILEDSLNFEMNSSDSPVRLTGRDVEDPLPGIYLSPERVALASTANGRLQWTSAGITYTPNSQFRGTDSFEFTVMDSEGNWSKKRIELVVGNPFHDLEPAIAARGVGCTSCHANVNSKIVTDFGYGTPNVFFGKDSSPLNSYYGDYTFWQDGATVSWATTSIVDEVLVPRAQLNVSWSTVWASASEMLNKAIYQTTTLAGYLREAEKLKPADKIRAKAVVEKDEVYIGALTPRQIRAKFQVSLGTETIYLKNHSVDSPNLSGLVKDAAGFHTNAAAGLVCDGDLFVEGTVFLNQLELKTVTGCRIHATGPIFIQGTVRYQNLATSGGNRTNLQLVSGRAISLGIGDRHCESATNPGWYYYANSSESPLEKRFFTHGPARVTRNTNPALAGTIEQTASDWIVEGKMIAGQGRLIASLKDASCESTREVHFERLLLNAPQVQSRYTGNFKGVVITEVPLFSLSQFKYEFDPVFTAVSVLPLVDQREFFWVK